MICHYVCLYIQLYTSIERVCECVCVCMLSDLHTYIHTYIQTDRQTDRQTDSHACMHACMHTFNQTDTLLQTTRVENRSYDILEGSRNNKTQKRSVAQSGDVLNSLQRWSRDGILLVQPRQVPPLLHRSSPRGRSCHLQMICSLHDDFDKYPAHKPTEMASRLSVGQH